MVIGARYAAAVAGGGSYWGLCFTAKAANSTVTMQVYGATQQYSPPTIHLFYSTDGISWRYFVNGADIATVTLPYVGSKVWIKAWNSGNSKISNEYSGHKFVFTGQIAASGNIQSLLNGNEETLSAPSYCYQNLFSGCTQLTTPPELPATTIGNSCYSYMFYGCTALSAAPELPATSLADDCYFSMFRGCTALSAAPDLFARRLYIECYNQMFYGCTSLVSPPEIRANTLERGCCSSMFRGCSSLTTAPALYASTAAINCYASMFMDCTSLLSTPTVSLETTEYGCCMGMFYGCTKLTTAMSILSPLILSENCYRSMFEGCVRLQDAPELPAEAVAVNCYANMFYSCTALKTITVGLKSWGGAGSNQYPGTSSWVGHILGVGTFYCSTSLGSDSTISRGESACPEGWDVVNTDAA